MESIHVQGAPNYYECNTGVLDHLDELLGRYGFKKGIVVHGVNSWRAAAPFFPQTAIDLSFDLYNGECSESEIDRLANEIKVQEADFIIGVGGGKVLDLAKAAGNQARRDVILIPTLAATCAAWTPLSVTYNDEGEFLYYTIFPRGTLMTLVEPRIILDSPVRYLRAGIGDTLAKWYEAEAITRELVDPPVPVKVALDAAKNCQQTLLEDSVQAVADLENGKLTKVLTRVIETNIIAGGMVGCYGDRYGRVAGAHSIHNGMTRVEETHHLLHGEKVAYGILVQLALENYFKEIDRLLPLFEDLQLPASLNALGIPISGRKQAVDSLVEGALNATESIHFMEGTVESADLIDTIDSLEAFVVNGGTKDV